MGVGIRILKIRCIEAEIWAKQKFKCKSFLSTPFIKIVLFQLCPLYQKLKYQQDTMPKHVFLKTSTRFILCTYVCRVMQSNQILISNPTSHWNNKNIHIWVVQKFSKQKKIVFFLVKLSYSLKGFNYLQAFLKFLLSNRAWRSSDTVRVIPEAYVLKLSIFFYQNEVEYRPSGAGGTRSLPATPHRLQHLPAHFIQNGRWGPGIGQTLGYWTLRSTFAK